MLLVDLSVHTCEMLKACTLDHLLSTSGMPTYYLGFAGGEDKVEWATQHFESWMTDGLLDGSVPLPKSMVLPAATLPPDLVEAAPPQPQLSVLTWCNSVKYQGLPTLKVPPAVLQKYHDHNRFGSEFQTKLEQIRSDLPVDMAAEKTSGSGNCRSNAAGPKRGLQPKTESGMAMPAKPAAAEQQHLLKARCSLVGL